MFVSIRHAQSLAVSKQVLTDGVVERHVEIAPDGEIHSHLEQPTRGLILEGLNELRKNPGALKSHAETDMGMGLEYTMPKADLWTLMRQLRLQNPGMNNKELNEQLTKWLRINGAIYRVRD